MSTVVFLGGGRITSAMLAGLRLGKTRHRLVVHDRDSGKLSALKKRYAVVVEPDLTRAVKQADVLIVAVRPSSVPELLQMVGKVTGKMSRKLLMVSLAAGVPLHALSKSIGPPVQWARSMPSPVCRSGRGLTALTFPRMLPRADRKRVHDLFASFGQVVEIPESKFDAFTVTYSCSHGYHALATLARAAQKGGLDRKTALLASAHALADGIIAWREGRHSLESLLEEATTPGGIAAATATAMDAAGYGRAVRQGVAAGLRRARANAAK
ncbi:MAG: NAD(P)-binding domain-containing protein [Terriglobales bacterium]|jgi:pyrroline-5-carboxylate reductase